MEAMQGLRVGCPKLETSLGLVLAFAYKCTKSIVHFYFFYIYIFKILFTY